MSVNKPQPQRYPLWLYALNVAAYISNIVLLLFAVFLISTAWPTLPVSAYALLMLLFCWANLRALQQNKRLSRQNNKTFNYRIIAHICSALLPLTYLLGASYSNFAAALELEKLLAICVPSLLNWLAVEETFRFGNKNVKAGIYPA